MATRDQMGAAIEPGSTAYGERQFLQQNLPSQQAPSKMGSPGRPKSPAPQLASPSGSGALGRLLEGKAAHRGGPLTDRLSVGPGAGPAMPETSIDPVVERLRYLASSSGSPRLRTLARRALRRRSGAS